MQAEGILGFYPLLSVVQYAMYCQVYCMSGAMTALPCNSTINTVFVKLELKFPTQTLRFSSAGGVGDHLCRLVKPKYLVILTSKHC